MNSVLYEKCKHIESSVFESYLIKNGWKELLLSKKLNYKIYQIIKNNELFQVNLPLHREYRDYYDMLYDACIVISNYENIDPFSSVDRILSSRYNIVKIRASDKSIVNGTMPLEEALLFFEQVKKIIADAAMDTFSRIKHRTAKYSGEVNNFINRCRFGQTEEGSYVVSVICPLDEKKEDSFEKIELFEDEAIEGDSNRVISKLIESTELVSKAIDNGEDLTTFVLREDDHFISLNFIEDLGDFYSDDSDSFIEIKANISSKDKINKGIEKTIRLDSNKKPAIRSFVEKYKNNENKETRTSFKGRISEVSANPKLENRDGGEVVVKSDETNFSYRAYLHGDTYNKAVEAHKNGAVVIGSGIKRNNIVDCDSFDVIEVQELFNNK